MVTIIGEIDWSAVILVIICLCIVGSAIALLGWMLLRMTRAVGRLAIYLWHGRLTKLDLRLLRILDSNSGLGMEYVTTSLELEGNQRVEGPEGLEYSLETSPVVCKQHRRVKKYNRIPYMTSVVAEVKVRFGTPTRTQSNEKAVHRYASEIMRKHGLRPTHARQLLPSIVAASFIPDKWEVKAAKMSSCSVALERLSLMPNHQSN